jgi:hypothetical protein
VNRPSPESDSVVDLDDPDTWPSDVIDWAQRWVSKLAGTTIYTADLVVPLERENEFRALLAGTTLRAYHCTRLLDHEVELIRQQGLRQLSAELVRERIDAAYEQGALTETERVGFHESHVFARGHQAHREGQVCLVLGRQILEEVHGVSPLLSTWGGEGIYMAAPELRTRLEQLGRPAIVVTQIDLSSDHRTHLTFPSLSKLFVGAVLDTEGRGADVFYRAAVPPEDVLEIWQPGHPEYDRNEGLPR